jgi:RNA 2',3'-cyclic 3'-phosphodiesterase
MAAPAFERPLRLFFAAAIGDPQRLAIAKAQAALRPAGGQSVRWVEPDSAHLTLVFLGSVEAARVEELLAVARSALAPCSPPTLRLGAAGAFPSLRRPRTLWLSLAAGADGLAHAQGLLASALETLGFAREARPFHPHLTLGRLRDTARPPEVAALATALIRLAPPDPSPWRVGAAGLYASELLREGPRYSLLGEAPLGSS